MIITIGNVKGGSGKTTITTNLAVLSAIEKKKTLLIDCDSQCSSMDWRSYRDDALAHIQCVSINKPTIHKDIADFNNFQNIFIDSGGKDSDLFRSAIMACDLLLVPITPSPYDIWSSEDTLKMLQQARIYKDIQGAIVLNQIIPNTNLSKEVLPLLENFSTEFDLTIAKSQIVSRQDFKKCVNEGKGVSEYSPKSKADEEIRNLYKEIFYGSEKKTTTT